MQEASVNETKRTFQPSDANNDSRVTEEVSERQRWNSKPNNKTQPEQEDNSLWDDPDMVPVPVLPVFSDNSIVYEVQDGVQGETRQEMPPSAHGNQPYFGGAASVSPKNWTIVGL